MIALTGAAGWTGFGSGRKQIGVVGFPDRIIFALVAGRFPDRRAALYHGECRPSRREPVLSRLTAIALS